MSSSSSSGGGGDGFLADPPTMLNDVTRTEVRMGDVVNVRDLVPRTKDDYLCLITKVDKNVVKGMIEACATSLVDGEEIYAINWKLNDERSKLKSVERCDSAVYAVISMDGDGPVELMDDQGKLSKREQWKGLSLLNDVCNKKMLELYGEDKHEVMVRVAALGGSNVIVDVNAGCRMPGAPKVCMRGE